MRSGYFNLAWSAGVFRSAGEYGRYWPSRADISDKNLAYYLAIDTGVNPSAGLSNRFYGRSLRCLSADLEG